MLLCQWATLQWLDSDRMITKYTKVIFSAVGRSWTQVLYLAPPLQGVHVGKSFCSTGVWLQPSDCCAPTHGFSPRSTRGRLIGNVSTSLHKGAARVTEIHLPACLWGSEELDLVSPGEESEEDELSDKGQRAETERGLLSNGIVTGSGCKSTEQNPSSKAPFSPEPKTESRSLDIYSQRWEGRGLGPRLSVVGEQAQEGLQPGEVGQPLLPELSKGTHPLPPCPPCRAWALCLLKQYFVPHQLFTRHSRGTGTAWNGDAAQMTAKICSPKQPELVTSTV